MRFQKLGHTFTTEEAIDALGSLKFSLHNRVPDPKNPPHMINTITSTTFYMAKEMARLICQQFLDARYIESAEGKSEFATSSKGAVWELTPKGLNIVHGFCQRVALTKPHINALLASPRNSMLLVVLERESDSDKIVRDRSTVEVIFRRFAGADGPNIKTGGFGSDSDSAHEYSTGLVGVRMMKERKIGERSYYNTFTGKAAVDWLMNCTTTVNKSEAIHLAELFIECGLVFPVFYDRLINPTFGGTGFIHSKNAIYGLTDRGQRIAGWTSSPEGSINSADLRLKDIAMRENNTNRMTWIISDPALRLQFREFLQETHCEENLAFYFDVRNFLEIQKKAVELSRSASSKRFEAGKEALSLAYSEIPSTLPRAMPNSRSPTDLYNTYLTHGSPYELNIDGSLRIALQTRMREHVGEDEEMIGSLDEIAKLLDQAQSSVFKLMASVSRLSRREIPRRELIVRQDSVPKFMRDPKYTTTLRERGLEVTLPVKRRSE